MKRLLLAILSCVYLVVASGMVISIHYCMGKKTGVDYRYQTSKSCDRCGMTDKKGCCHDDIKIVKMNDDQQMAKSDKIAWAAIDATSMPKLISQNQSVQGLTTLVPDYYYSPPDSRQSSIQAFISVFRI